MLVYKLTPFCFKSFNSHQKSKSDLTLKFDLNFAFVLCHLIHLKTMRKPWLVAAWETCCLLDGLVLWIVPRAKHLCNWVYLIWRKLKPQVGNKHNVSIHQQSWHAWQGINLNAITLYKWWDKQMVPMSYIKSALQFERSGLVPMRHGYQIGVVMSRTLICNLQHKVIAVR